MDGGELLRLLAPTGFGVPGRHARFKDWLNLGSYSPIGSVAATQFSLAAHDASDLTGALTDEFCACSLSAFESMLEVERGARVRKSLAWPAIKSYYAAFFAAHAAMRFLGVACTWLSGDDFSRLKQVASLHGSLAVPPRKGQWVIVVSGTTATFQHCGGGGAGGAHEEVWHAFREVMIEAIDKLGSNPLVTANESQKFVLFLDKVLAEVKSGMPTTVRNGVNYRRDYGVWYPYAKLDRTLDSLRLDAWRKGDTSTPFTRHASDLATLFGFSQALVSLCLSLSRAADKYFDGSAKRFSNGPLKLMAESAA